MAATSGRITDSLPGRLVWRFAFALAFGVGLLIWLLVFDMWLGQVERQYLWEQARHELHRGPGAALKVVMAQGIRDGALVATGWSALVVSAILGVAWYAGRVRASRDSRS